jgi:hypothetical protein
MCKNISLHMLGEVRLGEVRLGEVRLGKVRLGEVRSSSVDTLKTGGSFGLNTPILIYLKCIPISKQVMFLSLLLHCAFRRAI